MAQPIPSFGKTDSYVNNDYGKPKAEAKSKPKPKYQMEVPDQHFLKPSPEAVFAKRREEVCLRLTKLEELWQRKYDVSVAALVQDPDALKGVSEIELTQIDTRIRKEIVDIRKQYESDLEIINGMRKSWEHIWCDAHLLAASDEFHLELLLKNLEYCQEKLLEAEIELTSLLETTVNISIGQILDLFKDSSNNDSAKNILYQAPRQAVLEKFEACKSREANLNAFIKLKSNNIPTKKALYFLNVIENSKAPDVFHQNEILGQMPWLKDQVIKLATPAQNAIMLTCQHIYFARKILEFDDATLLSFNERELLAYFMFAQSLVDVESDLRWHVDQLAKEGMLSHADSLIDHDKLRRKSFYLADRAAKTLKRQREQFGVKSPLLQDNFANFEKSYQKRNERHQSSLRLMEDLELSNPKFISPLRVSQNASDIAQYYCSMLDSLCEAGTRQQEQVKDNTDSYEKNIDELRRYVNYYVSEVGGIQNKLFLVTLEEDKNKIWSGIESLMSQVREMRRIFDHYAEKLELHALHDAAAASPNDEKLDIALPGPY
jgi:hypothetical protein